MTYAFCPACGNAMAPSTEPLDHQTCAVCQHTTYHNPRPVVVNMIPCLDEHLGDPDRTRWLVGQRNIAPKMGEFAMISGFLELGESVEAGGIRELLEETTIQIPADVCGQLMGSLHVPHGPNLLVFCAWPALPEHVIEGFVPNAENQSLAWHTAHDPIAFALHHQALQQWGARAANVFKR